MNLRVAINTAAVLATLLGLALVVLFRQALLIFLLSLIVSAAIRPAIELLIARGLGPTVATITAYLLLLGTLVLAAGGMGERLLADIERAGTDLVNTYDYMTREWPHGAWLERQIASELPPKDKLLTSLAGRHGLQTLQSVGGLTFGAASIVVDLVFVLMLSVYWSLDRVRFERLWLSLLAAPRRVVARDIWRGVETEIGAYLRSEFLQCLLAAIFLSIGYWVLGHRFPVLLALIAAAAWTLPWMGVVVAGFAVLVLSLPALLLDGNSQAVVVTVAAMLYTCGVLLLLELVIEPRLFARQRYNMVFVAAASISLTYAFGLVGLLLGPPLAVALQVFAGHLLRQSVETRIVEETTDPLADLSVQLAVLHASLEDLPAPSPELSNLVKRLDDLLVKVRAQSLPLESRVVGSAASVAPLRSTRPE